MKKIILSAALAVAAATTANAADLPRKAPVYKAPIMQVYDWTGFYIGVNAGGSVGRDRTNLLVTQSVGPFPIQSNERSHLSPAGAIGGGQIGYNVQFRNFYNLVLGVEADIQGSGQRDRSTCLVVCVPGSLARFNQSLDWFGTARVRAGIATGPVLTYVTGGYAYGNFNTTTTTLTGIGTNVITDNRTRGGYAIGSGIEAQLGGNWTGKIEYLYVNLGSSAASLAFPGTQFGTVAFNQRTEIRDHVFRAGLNYRFGGNTTYSEPVANWNGFYIGGNVGSIIGRNRSALTLAPAAGAAPIVAETFTLVPDGFIGGGQIGYNWQAGAWVFGVEGDFQGSSAKDNKACIVLCITVTPTTAAGVAIEQKLPWLATARGRIGYSVGSTLFYGTAGYAYGETKTRLIENFTAITGGLATTELKRSKGGYVVGAGIESPFRLFDLFGPNWTTKTEYLYVDLGGRTNTFTAAGLSQTFSTQTREHIFRTGINYNFNTPVVAKY